MFRALITPRSGLPELHEDATWARSTIPSAWHHAMTALKRFFGALRPVLPMLWSVRRRDRSIAQRMSIQFILSPLLLCALLPLAVRAADKPNIVYMIVDDLGWKDVGFHGGAARTPHLDTLAKGGAMLNAFYVQPTSSQTRAAALTGRYPMRYGMQTGTLTAGAAYCLPAEERTLASALKEVGYSTALVGKWQLGHAQSDCLPNRRGFDHFFGPLTQPASHELKKGARTDWRHNGKPAKVDGDITALIGKAAAAQVVKAAAGTPFFLMVSFTAPAAPFGASKALIDSYASEKDEIRQRYLAAVSALDEAIGDIVTALDQRKLLADTLILVHSDSGAALPTRYVSGDSDVAQQAGDNDVFREGRGSLYEGGLRAPALAYWQGRLPAGNIVYDPVHVTDMTATLLALTGATPDARKKLDGIDLWPALAGGARSPRKEILLNVEDFHGALRIGEYKLIVHAALPSKVEVFHIANDPEEVENIAERDPERTRDMLKRLNEYAYDMLPALQVEAWIATAGGGLPALWRTNPARR